jgi:hypothetical protein
VFCSCYPHLRTNLHSGPNNHAQRTGADGCSSHSSGADACPDNHDADTNDNSAFITLDFCRTYNNVFSFWNHNDAAGYNIGCQYAVGVRSPKLHTKRELQHG